MKKTTIKQLVLLLLCLSYTAIGHAQSWGNVSPDKLYAQDIFFNYANVKVGIGTNSPSIALDVVGDIKASGLGAGTISATGTINTDQYYKLGGLAFIQGPGSSNTYVGINSGASSSLLEQDNTFLGTSSGYSNKGDWNTFIGTGAGYYNVGFPGGSRVGSLNTFIGNAAGARNVIGSYNVAIGSNSGTGMDFGNENTFIGYNAMGSTTLTNATAIGANAVVDISDALVLGNKAQVGIGLSAPQHTLHIKKLSSTGYALFSDSRTKIGSNCKWDNAAFAVGDDWAKAITVLNNPSHSEDCELGTLGETFCVYGNGTAWMGSVMLTSDARYKKNVKPIQDAMSIVKQLQGKKYDFNFNTQATTGASSYGFIAQEIEKVIPELVKTNDKGFKAVNYDGVIPFLVEAIKEQQKILEETKATIADLQQKLANSDATGINNHQTGDRTSAGVSLEQNAPNPFTNSTSIKYHITGETRTASMIVFDMNGTQIKRYELPIEKNGELIIQGSELRPGMYLYTLMTDGREVATKRMIMTSGY